MTKSYEALVEGVYALLLTPFLESGEIDYPAYEAYVSWQLSHRPQALFASCGTSELLTLTTEERLSLTRLAIKHAGDTPVVATANANGDPATHKEDLMRMIDTGVQAVVLIPPNGYGNDPERLQHYFAELADLSSVPVILYEFPGVKPHSIPADVYGQLVHSHGVSAIKDTTCTMEGITAKIQAAPDSMIIQANIAFLLESIQAGVRGIMAITSAAAASLNVQFWHKAISKNPADLTEAKRLHRELVIIDSLISREFTASAKHLVALHGIPFSTTTRTGAVLSTAHAHALRVWHEGLIANLR